MNKIKKKILYMINIIKNSKLLLNSFKKIFFMSCEKIIVKKKCDFIMQKNLFNLNKFFCIIIFISFFCIINNIWVFSITQGSLIPHLFFQFFILLFFTFSIKLNYFFLNKEFIIKENNIINYKKYFIFYRAKSLFVLQKILNLVLLIDDFYKMNNELIILNLKKHNRKKLILYSSRLIFENLFKLNRNSNTASDLNRVVCNKKRSIPKETLILDSDINVYKKKRKKDMKKYQEVYKAKHGHNFNIDFAGFSYDHWQIEFGPINNIRWLRHRKKKGLPIYDQLTLPKDFTFYKWPTVPDAPNHYKSRNFSEGVDLEKKKIAKVLKIKRLKKKS